MPFRPLVDAAVASRSRTVPAPDGSEAIARLSSLLLSSSFSIAHPAQSWGWAGLGRAELSLALLDQAWLTGLAGWLAIVIVSGTSPNPHTS